MLDQSVLHALSVHLVQVDDDDEKHSIESLFRKTICCKLHCFSQGIMTAG